MKSDIIKTIYSKTIFGQTQIAMAENINFGEGFQFLLIVCLTIVISLFVTFKKFDSYEL